MRLFLLLTAIIHVATGDVQYKCNTDDLNFNIGIGKYCYLLENGDVSPDFDKQRQFCEDKSGFLAGFDNLNDQNHLVSYIKTLKGDEFTPFYIGLQCNKYHWTWMNSDIPFDPDTPAFEDRQYNPKECTNTDSSIHFALTNESKWSDVMPSITTFEPQFIVCQMLGTDISVKQPSSYDDTNLVIGLAITCGILVILIIFMMIKFRKKISDLMNQVVTNSRDRLRKESTSNDVEKQSAPKDEWELRRQFVDIQYSNKLGTGAFGVVFLGQIDVEKLVPSSERSILQLSALKLNNGQVAVKMLHESADKLAEADFLQEIEIIKRIGFHERLVNIIASVTESLPHLLITEYCCNGDLLSFLKERREYMLALPPTTDYSTLDRSLVITQEQQLQFAVQIAYGLEFLSGRGFVHRDIAARNILVDERNGCKIGDFGLCRRVQEEQELYLSRGGRLPIKWMSPEALRRYEMSTASDVWSYGILLFEIITLGGSPYPNWAPSEILPRLEAGERMERPDNCPDAVFTAMSACWSNDPMKRPDFTSLRSGLAKALEESPSEYYLQLDAQRDYYLVPRSNDLPIPEDEFIRII